MIRAGPLDGEMTGCPTERSRDWQPADSEEPPLFGSFIPAADLTSFPG